MKKIIGVIIILTAMAAGLFLASGSQVKDPTPQVTFRPPPPPVIPELVPDLTLPDLKGHPHALSEWRGHPLLINFWASWCEPCRREIPLLSELATRHAPEGLEVLGIAVDFHDAVARYVHKTPLAYPTLIAEDDALAPEAFGLGDGIPVSVFASAQGHIVTVKTGALAPGEAELILGLIRQVDAGSLTLAAARAQIATRLRHFAAN